MYASFLEYCDLMHVEDFNCATYVFDLLTGLIHGLERWCEGFSFSERKMKLLDELNIQKNRIGSFFPYL